MCVVKTPHEKAPLVAALLSAFPDVPVLVLGRGSNLLVSDEGFPGVVVVVTGATGTDAISVDGDLVTAGGGVLMPVLARRSVGASRGGLEWCVGIPGTVGGAVRMNAGGHGADMVASLLSADIASCSSGTTMTIAAGDLGLHFRGSALLPHHIVTSVQLKTHETTTENGTAEINSVVAWRREHQPGGRNAGSVFVNPGDGATSAGALIDSAGLRGFCVGGAQVSEKHANFIQVSDGAAARDVLAVMEHVQVTVAAVHGVHLFSEVRLCGFDSDTSTRFADPRHTNDERMLSVRNLSNLLGESS
jgi:UDP-N-acetylmuramate dehydrogenase